jgi:hypothetical protein
MGTDYELRFTVPGTNAAVLRDRICEILANFYRIPRERAEAIYEGVTDRAECRIVVSRIAEANASWGGGQPIKSYWEAEVCVEAMP